MKEIIEKQRHFYLSNQTKPISFRIQQLKTLKQLLKDNEPRLNEAIYNDFRKSAFDTFTTELALLYSEIDLAIRKIRKWSAPASVATNPINFPGKSYIIPEPYGVALVIGAWNYPYQLSFGPAIAAIAAGNTVILKPSELPSNTSRLMAELVRESFDPAFFTVLEGGVAETTALLEQRFDYIFFTGSVRVGRLVYEAAAKNLSPVTLELGGKSPAFILDDNQLEVSVKRLIWAKFLNAGQTCIAPDYVLLPTHLKQTFLEHAAATIRSEQFAIENGNYVQIINERNLQRLTDLLDKDKIYTGGGIDRFNRTLEPTLMHDVDFDDAVMQEEIFGPILPVLTFDSLDEALSILKNREKPLSCYVFTQDKSLKNKILSELSFGSGGVNDAIMHISNSNLPFGGVGQSGIGSYHGKHGFDTFSHHKSILEKSTRFEPSIKYYPHNALKLRLIRFFSKFN